MAKVSRSRSRLSCAIMSWGAWSQQLAAQPAACRTNALSCHQCGVIQGATCAPTQAACCALCVSHQKEMSSSTCARFPHQINNAADAPIRGSTTHPNRHYVQPASTDTPATYHQMLALPHPTKCTEQVTRAHYLKAPEPGCSVNSTSQRACKLKNPLDLRLAQTAHTSTVLANCAWAPETL